MQKISGNSDNKHKSLDDWLTVIAITFFYILIIALTFFSAYWAFQYMPLAGWK